MTSWLLRTASKGALLLTAEEGATFFQSCTRPKPLWFRVSFLFSPDPESERDLDWGSGSRNRGP